MKKKGFILILLMILSVFCFTNKIEALYIIGEGNCVNVDEVYPYYAKMYPNRNGFVSIEANYPDEIKITDDGRFNNPYDFIDFSNYMGGFDVNHFKYLGYRTLVMEISFYIHENYNGTKYIYLYGSSSEDSWIVGASFSHSKDLDDSLYHFYFEIDLYNVINNYLLVRYDASGSGKDDWLNYGVSCQIDFSYDYRVTNKVYKSIGSTVNSSSYNELPISR